MIEADATWRPRRRSHRDRPGILPRPPFDPELAPMLEVISQMLPSTLTAEMLPAMRAGSLPGLPTPAEILESAQLQSRDVTIPGFEGADIVVSVIEAKGRTGTGPGIFHTHGGGMIMGDRFTAVEAFAEWIHRYNAVVVSVEYRLAPNSRSLPRRGLLRGARVDGRERRPARHRERASADRRRQRRRGSRRGCRPARPRQAGTHLVGQMLMYPMLDDRDATVSTHQIDGVGVWGTAAATCWAGTPCSANAGAPTTSRSTPRPRGHRPVEPAPGVHRLRERGGVPRRGRRPTPRPSGRPVGRPSCTSGGRVPRLRGLRAAGRPLARRRRRARSLDPPPARLSRGLRLGATKE